MEDERIVDLRKYLADKENPTRKDNMLKFEAPENPMPIPDEYDNWHEGPMFSDVAGPNAGAAEAPEEDEGEAYNRDINRLFHALLDQAETVEHVLLVLVDKAGATHTVMTPGVPHVLGVWMADRARDAVARAFEKSETD